MAQDPAEDLRKAKALLQELNQLKVKLGETPFDFGEKELVKQFKDLPTYIEQARGKLENMSDSVSGLYGTLRGITSEFKYQQSSLGKVRGAFKQLEDIAQDLKYDEQQISDLNSTQLKKLQQKLKRNSELLNQEARGLKNTNSVAKSLSDQVEQYKKLGASQDDINDYVSDYLRSTTTLTKEEKALLQLYHDQGNAVNDIEKKLENRITQEKKVNNLLGVGGAIVGGLSSVMSALGINSGIISDGFAEAEEAMRQTAKDIEAGVIQGGRLTVLMAGLGPIISSIGKALTDPLSAAIAIGKAFLEVNKEAVNYTRLTGTSAVNTAGMNMSLASSVDVLKVMTALTTEMGFAAGAIFSDKDLGRLAEAKNLLGLTDKQAANLGMRSKVAGKGIQDYEEGIVGATNKYNAANRSVVAHGLVLQEVLSTTDDIALSLGGNPEKIAGAAAAAIGLGLNLQKVDQIAGSMLNFEDSISNELEAELLTGKQLNLEKAREMALNNDLTGLSKELAKNGASAAEFSKMNRIQQESLAKALGMSREDLGKMAQQELLRAGATKEAQAAARGMTIEQLEQASVQDRIKISLDKLAQAFAPILEALAPVVEMIGSAIQPIAYIIGLVSSSLSGIIGPLLIIFGIFKGIQLVNQGILIATEAIAGIQTFITATKASELGIVGSLLTSMGLEKAYKAFMLAQEGEQGVLVGIRSALEETTLGTMLAQGGALLKNIALGAIALVRTMGIAAMSAISSLAAIPVVGWGLGIAAAGTVAAIGAKYIMGDGIIDPKKGPVVYGEFGTVQLHPKDQIAAGTNLMGSKAKGAPAQTISQAVSTNDNTHSEIKQMREENKSLLTALVNKSSDVYMDSNKVGKSQVLGSYKSA